MTKCLRLKNYSVVIPKVFINILSLLVMIKSNLTFVVMCKPTELLKGK